MADLRINSAAAAAAPSVQTEGRSEAARAAQRAFFQVALNPSSAPHPPAQTGAAQAARPSTQPAALQGALQGGDGVAPPRLPRPGSLLDIKV